MPTYFFFMARDLVINRPRELIKLRDFPDSYLLLGGCVVGFRLLPEGFVGELLSCRFDPDGFDASGVIEMEYVEFLDLLILVFS